MVKHYSKRAYDNHVLLLGILFAMAGSVSGGYREDESCVKECGVTVIGRQDILLKCDNTSLFNGSSFKNDFLFGTATSAYQIEGSARRGFNSWDHFTHYYPDKTSGDGDLATDSYHLYNNDVDLMVNMSLNAYRFSIAWSRVLPKGKGEVNEDGVNYYLKLLNRLRQQHITPFVTLFHWDAPQALIDEYGGFLDRRIIADYREYADLCFRRFGHLVKHWITLNQPYTVSYKGYGTAAHAPGRCSRWQNLNCTGGNSGTEPYIVTHHQLLAHAAAVNLYREKYKPRQQGIIGTTLIDRWFTPYNESDENDVNATKRAIDFFFGWFMEPLVRGDYPQIMRELVGDRLPHFDISEIGSIKGTFDFVGVNYYVAQYVRNGPDPDPDRPCVISDPRVNLTFFRGGRPIGPKAATFYYYPVGLRDILEYIKDNYGNPPVFVTENGYDDEANLPIEKTLNDVGRISYHCSHLCFLRCAILNGSNVNGYFAWSLLDNYEFVDGYSVRFGMNYVNFSNVADRRPKRSASWYTQFVEGNNIKGDNNSLVQSI
ncbi:PREDICTED: myrosinase 5-like [Tarenaya hassleriana]|uniref:myrosinase 5-like n=1 Tax=Tarenaya hassleriana TaxID=28532 RepID=UPI00053C61AD|nr:PREDICTED: myrosinase 5-like [Tarenaya hassleriana]